MTNLAFFDIDYTIYKGGSGPEFYKFVARKGWTEIDVLSRHQQMRAQFDAHKINYQETVEIAIQLLADVMRGKSLAEVEGWLKTFFEEVRLVNDWVWPVFDLLKKHNFEIYLVSASGSPLVSSLAEIVKADGWFASEFELVDNKYTGKVIQFLHSPDKAILLEKLKQEYQPIQVLAFGDSVGDAAMLTAADRAFVYQPWDEDFKKEAKQKGWEIVNGETIVEAVREWIG